MIVGVPREIKTDEYRVAMTPAGVRALCAGGHTVIVQRGAGEGSGFADGDYAAAGASAVSTIEELYGAAEMIVKVKEPIAVEYPLLRPGQILLTYLHLAADETLTRLLLERGVTSYAYETLRVGSRLPLLEPMSEIAGKMAALFGAVHLGRYSGGSGRLLGGAVGVERNRVLILGGGTAGKAAADAAAALGADVVIMDLDHDRMRYLADTMPRNVTTMLSCAATIASMLPVCDLVIGTVLIPGARAPKLVTASMLSLLKPGSVLVDVSIDQGGCFESSRPTTHTHPTFTVGGIVHYCVANMPGAYPRTSTLALTNATLPYVVALADHAADAVTAIPALRTALTTDGGRLYNAAVAAAHGIACEC